MYVFEVEFAEVLLVLEGGALEDDLLLVSRDAGQLLELGSKFGKRRDDVKGHALKEVRIPLDVHFDNALLGYLGHAIKIEFK